HTPSLKYLSFMCFFPCECYGQEAGAMTRRRSSMPWYCLETNCLAVTAAVAGRDIAEFIVAFVHAPDELAGAEIHIRIVHRLHGVAQRAQALDRLAIHGRLDVQREIAVDLPARRAARRLRLLVVVEHADHGLQVALRLHVAAHDAKAHHRLPAAGQEARDNGVEGPLAPLDHVG